jgi:hypothetical protein
MDFYEASNISSNCPSKYIRRPSVGSNGVVTISDNARAPVENYLERCAVLNRDVSILRISSGMADKKRLTDAILASVIKEMAEPRLTASVQKSLLQPEPVLKVSKKCSTRPILNNRDFVD